MWSSQCTCSYLQHSCAAPRPTTNATSTPLKYAKTAIATTQPTLSLSLSQSRSSVCMCVCIYVRTYVYVAALAQKPRPAAATAANKVRVCASVYVTVSQQLKETSPQPRSPRSPMHVRALRLLFHPFNLPPVSDATHRLRCTSLAGTRPVMGTPCWGDVIGGGRCGVWERGGEEGGGCECLQVDIYARRLEMHDAIR